MNPAIELATQNIMSTVIARSDILTTQQIYFL